MLYIIVALGVGVMLLYIPSFLYTAHGTSLQGLTDVVDSLESGVQQSSFFNVLIVGAAVSLPIAFDIILDMISKHSRSSGGTSTKKVVPSDEKGTITAKITSIPGGLESVRTYRFLPIVIFSVPYFLMAIFHIPAHYVMATLMSQRMLIFIYILFSLRCDILGIWTENVTRRLALINIASCVLNYYADISDPNDVRYIVPLYVIATLVGTMKSLYFGWNSWQWIAKMTSDWWTWQGSCSAEEHFCFVFMVLAAYHSIAIVLVRGVDLMYRPLNHEGVVNLVTWVLVDGIIIIVASIMPGRAAQNAVLSANNELAVKGKFVRYMIHEIRNPTSIVTSGLEMIREKVIKLKYDETGGTMSSLTTRYDNLLESLGDIEAANHIATEVLNDFLTFDKLKSRMLIIEPKILSAMTYVDAAIRPFYLPAQQRGIELFCDTHIQPNELTELQSSLLFVDESKVGQVIRNLLSNAMKFSKKGGKIMVTTECIDIPHTLINSTIGSSSRVEEGGIDIFSLVHVDSVAYHCKKFMRLSVQDTGPGISLENQRKLFQEYMQINPGQLQNGGGSGLGLSIAKSIVEKHGGCIGLTSEGEGYGSTFFIEMPLFTVIPPKVVGEDEGSCRGSVRPRSMRSGRSLLSRTPSIRPSVVNILTDINKLSMPKLSQSISAGLSRVLSGPISRDSLHYAVSANTNGNKGVPPSPGKGHSPNASSPPPKEQEDKGIGPVEISVSSHENILRNGVGSIHESENVGRRSVGRIDTLTQAEKRNSAQSGFSVGSPVYGSKQASREQEPEVDPAQGQGLALELALAPGSGLAPAPGPEIDHHLSIPDHRILLMNTPDTGSVTMSLIPGSVLRISTLGEISPRSQKTHETPHNFTPTNEESPRDEIPKDEIPTEEAPTDEPRVPVLVAPIPLRISPPVESMVINSVPRPSSPALSIASCPNPTHSVTTPPIKAVTRYSLVSSPVTPRSTASPQSRSPRRSTITRMYEAFSGSRSTVVSPDTPRKVGGVGGKLLKDHVIEMIEEEEEKLPLWDRNVDRLKILVIDDSALNRKMVIKVVAGKSPSHEFVECDGGVSAIVCMENNLKALRQEKRDQEKRDRSNSLGSASMPQGPVPEPVPALHADSIVSMSMGSELAQGSGLGPAPGAGLGPALEPALLTGLALALGRGLSPALSSGKGLGLMLDLPSPTRDIENQLDIASVAGMAGGGGGGGDGLHANLSMTPTPTSPGVGIHASSSPHDGQPIDPLSPLPTSTMPYSCVLVDYTMPEMSGPTCVQHLRELGYKGVVIGVTGHATEEATESFLSHGANSVVVKPLRYENLMSIMQESKIN